MLLLFRLLSLNSVLMPCQDEAQGVVKNGYLRLGHNVSGEE